MKKIPSVLGAIAIAALAFAAVPQPSAADDFAGPDKELCEFLIDLLGLDVPLGECMSFFAKATNPATSDNAAAICQEMRTFGVIERNEVGACMSAIKSQRGG